MNANLLSKLEIVERLISAGKIGDAAIQIKKLISRKVPRPHVAALAGFARRANLPHDSLRLLSPYVRLFEKEASDLATADEKIQYASTLIYIGATQEGFQLLDTVSSTNHPDVSFHRALGLISEWRYDEAAVVLETYLKSAALSSYQSSVARANLFASLLFLEKFGEAQSLRDRLITETEAKGMENLRGNIFQLSTILAIHQNDEKCARDYLAKSEKVFGQSPRNLRLLRKWRAVLEITVVRGGNKEKWIESLRNLSTEAIQSRQWELRRDCEKYVALATRDEQKLLKLYFGTPYENYRTHLLKEWGEAIELPKDYLWKIGDKKKFSTIDVTRAEIAMKPLCKAGGINHLLLRALSGDFYRPIRIAELHAKIYPGLHYHPDASPARVKTAVLRLRKDLEGSGISDAIQAQGNGYGFSKEASLELLVSRGEALNASAIYLGKLASAWPVRPFTAKEASKLTELPRRSLSRLLREALEQGSLQQEGRGKSSRYRFGQK